MLLKVCGMVKPENISELVKLNPNFMGFIYYNKSPRFVGSIPSIAIPNTIKKVGVFVNKPIETILKIIERDRLNAIQLHGNESPEFCNQILEKLNTNKLEVLILKAFPVNNNFNFKTTLPYTKVCNYFLFDTKTKNYGGSGKKFNWNTLENYTYKTPFFLSGGIDITDVKSINKMNHKKLVGVDINSKFEDEPGLKNIQKIAQFKTLLQ